MPLHPVIPKKLMTTITFYLLHLSSLFLSYVALSYSLSLAQLSALCSLLLSSHFLLLLVVVGIRLLVFP